MVNVRLDDGVRIHYRTMGDGKLGVVLLHGWMASSRVFEDLVEVFDLAGLTVLLPDLRGAGASDAPEDGYTIGRYARDIEMLLTHHDLDRYVLVGHSMGGQIAQWLAAECPQLVLGMALICPVPASGLVLPEELLGTFRQAATCERARRVIVESVCRDLDVRSCERLLEDASGIAPECIAGALEAWVAGGFAEKLSSIEAPTLVVATEDPSLPLELLDEAVVQPIPRARRVLLPGAGHYPQIERPRELSAVLQAFLTGLIN